MKRILSFGTLVDPAEVEHIPEAFEAANRFQFGLLSGLKERGVEEAEAITAFPIATVPRPRRLLVEEHRWESDGVGILAPGFLNVPPIKPVWVHAALRRAGLSRRQGVEAVLSYNAGPGPGSAALSVARTLGVPLISVVAEYSFERPRSPLRVIEWRWRTSVIKSSDGLVVLSGHVVTDLGMDVPWVKVDGGLSDDWDELPRVDLLAKTIVYAGTPAYVSGARLLLDAFRSIDDPEMRLVFAGRGGLMDEVRAAASVDPRIRIEGFLPRRDMQRLLAGATVLVNPRLSSEEENRFNFPSKILDYLASARPVVTTLAGDLDPVYREVAVPLLEETPTALARLLQELCARPEEELRELGARGRRFVLTERRWTDQAERVYELILRVLRNRPA